MWTIRETKQREAQVKELGRRIGMDSFAGIVDFALGFTLVCTSGDSMEVLLQKMDKLIKLAEQIPTEG